MQIPKSFKLGKQTWGVAVVPRMRVHGRVYPAFYAMKVAANGRKPEKVSETFWHETTHAILYDMGDPRWNDEKFVTAFSKRLNQIINTAKL